jgi:hypothetical protein
MVRPMTTNFWLLEHPHNQKLATLAEGTKLEQITCPVDESHRRGGRRLGDLRAAVDLRGIKDFTWTWQQDILASEHLLDVFLKHRVTGYEIRPATVSYSKPSSAKPPRLHELIIIGWGGMASNAAGVKVRDTCDACKYRDYTIANPGRLIDSASWDGSDLFIVWPLPRYHFASDRLASILREENITGVKFVPAAEIPFKPGNVASPGLLTTWMPASRAHALGHRLGII